jgi:hypothetical protein
VALAAASCVAAGVGAVLYAVTAHPGLDLPAYVSEAGVPGYPHAGVFRAGILLLAAGLALLGAALARRAPLAAGLLVPAGVAAAGSGAVSCSDGCPLPPYEIATAADLLHGAASILAVAATVFAMLALARPGPDRLLRWLSLVAAGAALPLSGAVGLAMLLGGHGATIGMLQRLLLAIIGAWLLSTALRLGQGDPADRA